MNVSILIDWKMAVALGVATMGIIFAVRMDASSSERFLTKVADNCKDVEIAKYSNL